MSSNIPEKMKAIFIEDWKQEPAVKYDLPIPKPQSGQVLIKVMAVPINPADNAFLKGKYSTKRKPPCAPGLEGAGLVVQSGGGIIGWSLVGKKVSFVAKDNINGSWQEYVVAEAMQCIPHDDSVTYEQAACAIGNPFTVIGMLDIMQNEKHKVCIQSAACSACGKMMLKHFTASKITVINIVRRKEQVEILQQECNAKYILNSSDEDFDQKLKQMCEELKPTCFWDAVAGELTGKVLNVMPRKSIAYVYGSLSLTNSVCHPIDFIYSQKQVKGYWVLEYLRNKNLLWQYQARSTIQSNIKTTLSSKIQKEFVFEDVIEAIAYYKKNMSEGKVLLKPTFQKFQQEAQQDSQKVGQIKEMQFEEEKQQQE